MQNTLITNMTRRLKTLNVQNKVMLALGCICLSTGSLALAETGAVGEGQPSKGGQTNQDGKPSSDEKAGAKTETKIEAGAKTETKTEVDLEAIKKKLSMIETSSMTSSNKRLMEFGLAPGTGISIQIPVAYLENRTQSTAAVGGMAYIAFHPFYWQQSLRPMTRRFCANSWIGGATATLHNQTRQESDEFADSEYKMIINTAQSLRKHGKVKGFNECLLEKGQHIPAPDEFNCLKYYLETIHPYRNSNDSHLNATTQSLVDYLDFLDKADKEKGESTNQVGIIVQTTTIIQTTTLAPPAQTNPEPKTVQTTQNSQKTQNPQNSQAQSIADEQRLLEKFKENLSGLIWNTDQIKQCRSAPWGWFLGLSFPYTAQINGPTGSVDRNINPGFSFGFAFSPSAYLSMLAGITYSTFEESSGQTPEKNRHNLITATLGIGGNLDIFTKLLLR